MQKDWLKVKFVLILQVSICKFKFTGGAKPTLEEKKMMSVDSGGNFRYYSGDNSDLRAVEKMSKEVMAANASHIVTDRFTSLTSDKLAAANGSTNKKLSNVKQWQKLFVTAWTILQWNKNQAIHAER